MWCWDALPPCVHGLRRCVLLVLVVLTVLLLHLLVQRQVVAPLTFFRQWGDVGEGAAAGEAVQVTSRSVVTTPPRRDAAATKGGKAALGKKDDPFENQIILDTWPPKVKFPLMLFNNPGRLGNRLNSYAVALAFHAAHNATATTAVTRGTMNQLVNLLDTASLTLPVVDQKLVDEAKKNKARVSVGIPSWKRNDMISHLEPSYERGEEEYRETGEPRMYSLQEFFQVLFAAARPCVLPDGHGPLPRHPQESRLRGSLRRHDLRAAAPQHQHGRRVYRHEEAGRGHGVAGVLLSLHHDCGLLRLLGVVLRWRASRVPALQKLYPHDIRSPRQPGPARLRELEGH